MYKVILFSHEYPPCLGGVGTIASQIFNHFKSHDLFTINVITSIRTSRLKKTRFKTSNLPHKFWFISYYYEFRKEFKDADVIICNDPAAIYIAGKYFSDDLLKKTVCFIHGEEKYLNSSSLFAKVIRFRKHFLKAFYNSTKTLFVSKYIEQFYSDIHGVNLGEKSGGVINPGFSSSVKVIPVNGVNKNNFITVCRLHERKGFDHMLKVFEKLFFEGVRFKWTIVGGGEYLDNLTKMVKLSIISEYVNIIGPLSREELPNLYCANDYCILLSEFNESYGLSYLEAAYFGVKPIGYNRCGVKDVFNYIGNGLLLDDYLDIDSNTHQIQSFLNKPGSLPASSSRSTQDFVQDLESIILGIVNDENLDVD
jgi:glycosyltransferase involved in cell wall biosynthesis